MNPHVIADEILRQTEARGPGKSICPSEVARALHDGPDPEGWRRLMTPVRQAAATLSGQGLVLILRKGKPVPAEAMRGVIRLGAIEKDPA